MCARLRIEIDYDEATLSRPAHPRRLQNAFVPPMSSIRTGRTAARGVVDQPTEGLEASASPRVGERPAGPDIREPTKEVTGMRDEPPRTDPSKDWILHATMQRSIDSPSCDLSTASNAVATASTVDGRCRWWGGTDRAAQFGEAASR